MEDKKVFKFLQTFSKRQLNRFGDYLNSPYFNKSEELCFIYGVAKKHIQNSSKKSFEEYFEKQLPIGKKPISSTNLDKYLSRIFQFALDFVAMEQYKEDKFLKQNFLMNHFIEVDELGMFNKVYNKTESTIEKAKLSFENLLNKYKLELIKSNYLITNSTSRKGKQNLQETSDALDQFYLTQKYELELLKLTVQKVTNQKYNYYLINDINKTISKEFPDKNAILSFLLKGYDFEKNKKQQNISNFERMSKVLYKNHHKLDQHIVNNFAFFLSNKVWLLFGKKNESCYKYLFDFNKVLIEKRLIYYKNTLGAPAYKNIVDVAIRVKEFDWCEKFIESNKVKIVPVKQALDIYNYSQARIKFYSGKYLEVIDLVQKLYFADLYYKLAVKRLEIMAFYELKEYLFIESQINAFRVMLTPKRNFFLQKEHRYQNKVFINCINNLVKLYQPPNSSNEKYIKELNKYLKESNIPHQIWFSNKIKEAVI